MTAETKARMIRVAQDDPYMPLSLLAERFGTSRNAAGKVLQEAGIPRGATYFSCSINGRRKMK